ncbi:MAG TPA: hypothetical protein VHQ95_18330 [Pyrinomonadaceae bacterium]|jgi:hypothetical protein|nr:hypothetical protein [Pyrinomonadaceae bacterium]
MQNRFIFASDVRALILKPNHKRIAAYHQSPADFDQFADFKREEPLS